MPAKQGKKRSTHKGAGPDPSDRCYTPAYAVLPLIRHLKPYWRIWEPAAGAGNITAVLKHYHLEVEESDLDRGDDQDFYTYQPEAWSAIVTNPPYSQIRKFLERAYQLDKPWAMLIKAEQAASPGNIKLFQRYGVEYNYLSERVDYFMPDSGYQANGARFPSIWLSWKVTGKPVSYWTIDRSRMMLEIMPDQIRKQYETPIETLTGPVTGFYTKLIEM